MFSGSIEGLIVLASLSESQSPAVITPVSHKRTFEYGFCGYRLFPPFREKEFQLSEWTNGKRFLHL